MPTRSEQLLLAIVAATLSGLAGCTANGAMPTTHVPSASASTAPPEVPGRILFSRILPSGETRHFTAGADGSGETPFGPERDFEARGLSPDGSLLAIAAENEHGLVVGGTVDVDGSGFRLFENADPRLNLVCGVWGPKERMACEGWDDTEASRAGIYTVRASDGSGARRLTRHRDIPCGYSPDGRELAFIRTGTDDTRGTLMVMDAAGGNARSLLADVVLTGIPCDWSPDGSSILTAGGDGRLAMVTLDGTSSPLVGAGIGGFAAGGSWSPDGSHILFSMTFEGDQWDVYVVAADGSNLTRITDSELVEEGAIWLPTTEEPQSALEGTWETDTIAAAEMRAVALDAGVLHDRVLHGSSVHEVERTRRQSEPVLQST